MHSSHKKAQRHIIETYFGPRAALCRYLSLLLLCVPSCLIGPDLVIMGFVKLTPT